MSQRRSGRHLPIDADRRRIFLDHLAKGASLVTAARAASPHCTGHDFGLGGFTALARRDPEFAAEMEQAQLAALGEVEDEIRRRAMNPPTRPVWHKGELVGHYEDRSSSDRLLVRLAERLDPDHWAPQSKIKSEVDVVVRGAMLAIQPHDVMLLDDADQEAFVRLLTKIADRREDPNLVSLGRTEANDDGA